MIRSTNRRVSSEPPTPPPPVAMIMHAVRAIDGALTKKWADYTTSLDDLELDFPEHKGIQVIFLDGEEAFVSWTATDSIYGARSLA